MNVITEEEYIQLKNELIRLAGKEKRTYWMIKRMIDVVGSLLGLIVLSPLFIIICIMILLDDPKGSPIYSQDRVGRNGKVFRLYKFRSMVVGADSQLDSLQLQNEKDGPVFKIRNDPRITKIGRILRCSSLDELPQLWNVLQGDMSLVGPRPPRTREVTQYTEYDKLRLLVTPGLTCYWQTCNDRDSVTFHDWVEMDIKYIKERSILLDMRLIFRTFFVMLAGQGV